jgi:hypothetical protein
MDALRSLYDFTMGTTALAQLIQVALLVFISYTVLIAGKNVMDAITTYAESTTPLLPHLYDGAQVIYQNPNQKGAITISPSVNAPSGLEFSYACFLMINKSSFHVATPGLRHIFHKGSPRLQAADVPWCVPQEYGEHAGGLHERGGTLGHAL